MTRPFFLHAGSVWANSWSLLYSRRFESLRKSRETRGAPHVDPRGDGLSGVALSAGMSPTTRPEKFPLPIAEKNGAAAKKQKVAARTANTASKDLPSISSLRQNVRANEGLREHAGMFAVATVLRAPKARPTQSSSRILILPRTSSCTGENTRASFPCTIL